MRHVNLQFPFFISKPNHQYLAIIIITILAGFLRFYKLGDWSFWGDEMFTVSGREDGFNYNVVRQSISLMLIQYTVSLFGITEWNARLAPALFGVLSIPILFFLVKNMFNNAVGLAAALLLALSPWHLYWSQNARFYVALLLFYTLALFAFYFGIEKDRPWYLIISLVLLGLAVKERLLALFFVPVIVSYLMLLIIVPFEKPPGLRWQNLALFFMPCLAGGLFFIGPYLLNLPEWIAGFGYVNNNPFWLLPSTVFYIGIPMVCFAISGALYLLLKKSRAALLLSLSAVIPLIIIVIISPFHYTASRYVFISLTSWVILAALAVIELFSQSQKNVRVLILGAVLFLFLQPLSENILYYRFQNGNRDNWKAAFEFVKSQKSEGDLVITYNPGIGDYYLQDKTIGLRQLDIVDIIEMDSRVWFVEDMIAQQAFPDVHKWLEKNAQEVANYDVHFRVRNFAMRVYLYDPSKHLGYLE